MNRMSWALMVVALSVCNVGLVSGECVVIAPAGMKDWAQKAFTGRLSERNVRDGVVELSFDVARVWKGVVPKRVSLFQLPSIDMVRLEVGKSYVVFARSMAQEDRLRLGLSPEAEASVLPACNGAVELRDDDLTRELGSGTQPK